MRRAATISCGLTTAFLVLWYGGSRVPQPPPGTMGEARARTQQPRTRSSRDDASLPHLVQAVRHASVGLNATFLVPRTAFVAWDGVLALAFEGFPPVCAAVA
eukprot:COSAG01_NODE_2076_length_8486_cov_41.323000_10_plen_102_part_00